jgi:hypothetical protein
VRTSNPTNSLVIRGGCGSYLFPDTSYFKAFIVFFKLSQDDRGTLIISEIEGPLSLVRTTEELLEGKSTGSGLENRD